MNLTEYYKERWNSHKVEKLMTHFEIKEFTDSRMKEMKEYLVEFKMELSKAIETNSSLPYASFKKNFYPNLENLMYEVMINKNVKQEEELIDEAYTWFKKKLAFFQKLKNINRISIMSEDEKRLEEEVQQREKDNCYEAQNYPVEFEEEFRTNPNCSLKLK